jgi:hypothetical protein
MPIVTTGQITIVDNNDARPITAYITATPGTQQIYSKDESTVSWLPDWTTGGGLVLSARVFIGGTSGAEEVTGQLTNRRWSTNLSTALTGTGVATTGTTLNTAFNTGTFSAVHNTSVSTLTILANMRDNVGQQVIYFEGDYTDPTTSLTSRVIAQIQLGVVRTGTNAVYVLTRGQTSIEQATGQTKNVAVVAADLMRAAGVDTTGITYRFYENNGATQIINTAGFTSKYGMKSTAFPNGPTDTGSTIGQGLPASGAWSANNTLVIHESAVQDLMVFRVEARDADNVVYQAFFTIYDVSDPYQLNIISSSGDKLQNGVGSTTLTPQVFNGATQVTNLTGWSFLWTFFNRNGLRGAFIDTTRTAVAGGRDITAHTTGTTATFTYSGAAITFAAGDIIKVVAPGGAESFYEVAAGSTSPIAIRTPVTNTWLNFTSFPAPAAGQFVGGKLFVCRNPQGQVTTSGATGLTLTGDEVDVKANIVVTGDRP